MKDSEEGLPEQVDVKDARVIVARRDAVVIDIRSEEDFAEERIFGSSRCDPDEVEGKLDETRGDDGDDRSAILLVCEDGSRSAELAAKLRGDDREISSLDGGFAAWAGEHLPTAPGRDEEYQGPPLTIPGAVDPGGGEEEEEEAGEAETDEQGERAKPRAEEAEDEEQVERAEGG